MAVDNGAAPCSTPRLLSLALARPAVRESAAPGDVLLGVASARIDREHGLIYLARVTGRVGAAEYFAEAGPYAGRADCVYRPLDLGFARRPQASAYDDHDSSPGLARADVLLSQDFRYFGASRAALPREVYPRLRALLEAHGHGVRRHGAGAVAAELDGLFLRITAAFPDAINGKPTHRAAQRCDPGDDLEVVET